jgi:hypothetical protein
MCVCVCVCVCIIIHVIPFVLQYLYVYARQILLGKRIYAASAYWVYILISTTALTAGNVEQLLL